MSTKNWMLVALLIVIAGAALVYFDPFELHLLDTRPAAVAVKPAPSHVPVTAVRPAIPATHTPPAPVPVPVPTVIKIPAKASASVAATPVTPSKAEKPALAQPAAPAVLERKPPIEPSPSITTGIKPVKLRPKNLDLRHCLKLETDVAIAKCAGE